MRPCGPDSQLFILAYKTTQDFEATSRNDITTVYTYDYLLWHSNRKIKQKIINLVQLREI